MNYIKSEKQYNAIIKRIEALAELIDDNTPKDDELMLEFDLLASVVVAYDEEHYLIGKSSVEKDS